MNFEVSTEDIKRARVSAWYDKPQRRSKTCPVAQALLRLGYSAEVNYDWIQLSGDTIVQTNDQLRRFISLCDRTLDQVKPAILELDMEQNS